MVDDEELIVQGLVGMIRKADELNLEVYKAYSAEQALDWLGRTKIDIVLSDISMPGMDGLALQKEINRLWPHCRIIFLTGYSDFSYVKEALRHQAVDYILKAEGDDMILESIRKAAERLDREFESKDLLQQAREQLHKAIPALQKEYVMDILQNEPRALRSLESQLSELRIPLRPEQSVLLLQGKVDEWGRAGNVSDRALMLHAVQNIAADFLKTSCRLFSCAFDRSKIVWLLQSDAASGEASAQEHQRIIRFVEGMLESIQENCRKLFDLKISFVLAKRFSSWDQAAERFEALQRILSRSYYLGQEVLLTEESFLQEMTAERERAGVGKLLKKTEQLEELLESGLREEFDRMFGELAADAKEDVPTVRVAVYHRLVVAFISYMTKAGCYQAIGEKFNLSRLTDYESHGSWEEAMEYFRALAELNFEHKLSNAQRHGRQLVGRVRLYIEENLGGDLSLTRIGEWISLNPYYLSRLFKQLTGENLTETIMEARLDRAKKLLLDTNMKIVDIASQVGFESNAYFHRFFKKATHLTPQEFRENVKSDN